MPSQTDFAAFLEGFQSPKFRSLRPAQAYVLDQYNGFLGRADIGVELPTGAGKTLIALLISEIWRREGRKVAILSANKTLARQMLQEAGALGVPAVLMEGAGREIPGPDKRAYQRTAVVGIMNYWVYFNQQPVIDPADLLVMDDAHLAEHCLHSLYSVEVDKHRHEALFRSLVAELRGRFSEYAVMNDALADDSPTNSPAELLSFLDQAAVSDRIRDIIDASPCLRADRDLGFRWGRLRNCLNEANIYVSLNSVWMRPYIYPLMSNEHYRQTAQRLYVSATVGDPADLARRLGTRPIDKIPVPSELAQQTYGRRLIVMNRIDDEDIPARLAQVIFAALRIHPKSVWLCSSHAEATRVQQAVSDWLDKNGLAEHPTWVLTSLGSEIDEFKQSPRGHLFVGGRFDGMDFNADECRLIVVKTLPRAINPQEDFISAYLKESGFMRRRLNQRIVQALGRCNRSEDDFGAYVLADRRFATHFGRESNREGIPPNMVAEIDMAQDHAEIEQAALLDKVERFLRNDFTHFDAEIQAYRRDVPATPTGEGPPDTAAEEVVGWTALFASQNYGVAADKFEECYQKASGAHLLETAAFHAWNWAKALFLQSLLGEPSAREKALQLFEGAVMRGGKSSWFNRMRASLNRARQLPTPAQAPDDYAAVLFRAFDDLLERLGTRGDRFDRWCERLTAGLRSEHHDQFCEALEQLGGALAYHGSRPRHQGATDCRWRGSFGNAKELITFEVKIEDLDRSSISLGDVGQAHNQAARAEAEYEPQGYATRGTIITHLNAIDSAAEASAGGIRVFPRPTVLDLWERLRLLLSLYRDRWSLDDMQARSAAAQSVQGRIPPTGWLIRALDGPQRFVRTDLLLGEWP